MDIETVLVAYLLAHTGTKALIGTRLYPDVLPQEEPLPALVYQSISDVKLHSLTGQYGLEQPIYQITVYGATRATAKAVAAQVKSALCDYSGDMGGITVQKIELQTELTSLETTSDGTVEIVAVDLEFQIFYNKE